MTLFIVLIITISIFLIGYMVIQLSGFLNTKSFLEKLSYSWGLGVGLVGAQLFTYTLININWNRMNILLPWILIFLYFLIKRIGFPTFKKPKLSTIEIFFLFLIFLLILFTGFESILRPVQAWDGWVNWVFRPKVFFLENTIDPEYVNYVNTDYPIMLPLMGTFGYILMGQINDTSILFLFFVFYATLGGVFFTACKSLINTKIALIFTFLLLSLQNLIRHGGRFEVGQADLALGYYFFCSAYMLADFLKTREPKQLFLLSIFLGITSQIKTEGVTFFLFVNAIIIFFIFSWKKYRLLLYMFPSLFVIGTWELYKIFNHYPINLHFSQTLHIHWTKIIDIFLGMSGEFINFQNWNLLWIFFFLSIIVFKKNIKKTKPFLLLFCLQWLIYFTIFMINPIDPALRIEGTIDRLYIHLAPLAVLITSLLIQPHFFSKIK